MPRDNNQESQLKLFFSRNPDVVVRPVGRGRAKRSAGADAEITHTSLDGACGGTFSIPPERLEEFYHAYGTDMHRGLPLYMVERHTEPVFVMHLDVDFKALEQPERVQAFCELVQATVAAYYREPVTVVVCAVVDARGQRKPGAPGLHFIFPRTPVTREQALTLRSGIVARCLARLPWGGDWDAIIDISVLSNRGGALRMIGSDKCRPCEPCGRRDFCALANCRFARVFEDKIYWPWKIFPVNEATELFLKNMDNRAWAAKQCTVRCLPGAKSRPDFAPPALAPGANQMIREMEGRRGVRNADGGFVYALRGDRGGAQERGFEDAQLEEATQAALLRTIQGYHAKYEELNIRRGGVLRSLDADGDVAYLVKVQGFGEKYCCNKAGAHHGSTIYFAVSGRQGRIYQKCYCKKDELRAGGTSCPNYSGPKVFLPDTLYAALLGERAARPGGGGGAPARPSAEARQLLPPPTALTTAEGLQFRMMPLF